MVKLVRLTTENNNNFNANMDSDLILGEKASVALQNLTFETDFQALSVTGIDRVVSYNFDETAYPGQTHNSELKLGEYTASNYNAFFTDLEGTLNDTIEQTDTAVTGSNQPTYQQYNITADDPEKRIQLRLTPMLHPLLKTRSFNYNYAANDPQSDYERTNLIFTSQPRGLSDTTVQPPTTVTDPAVWLRAYNQAGPNYAPIYYGIVQREEGTRSTAIDRYIHPAVGVEWSKGSAVWWCRVHLLTSNSGNKDAHGFAIGLSKTQITGQAIMPDSHRDYEIRVHDTNHNIFYIDPTTANTLTDGGVAPHDVGAGNEANHDIIMLRKDKNVIKGVYLTAAGGGTETVLFTHTIPASERNAPLYPYAYWCGAGDEDQMGQPSLTIDPFAIDTTLPDGYNAFITPRARNQYGKIIFPDTGTTNGYSRCSAALQTVLPFLSKGEEYYISPTFYHQNQLVSVSIAKDVLRFLGFNGPDYSGSGSHTFNPPFNRRQFAGTYGFELIPETEFQVSNSDNYVVILDSDPLVSYDASKSQGLLLNSATASKIGRRLNILATIPVNDNNGFVEYQANELVYIDMGNEFPKNISN